MSQTVTFVRADGPTVRVREGGGGRRVFELGQPVKKVPEKTVEALKALPGLHFKFEKEDS